MKIQHILVSAATALLLTAGNAWAGADHRPLQVKPKPVVHVTPKPVVHVIPKPVVHVTPKPVVHVIPKPIIVVTPKPVIVVKPKPVYHVKPSRGPKGGGHHKAPEIDAASGTSAIALLTGVLLLAGERIRSRRS